MKEQNKLTRLFLLSLLVLGMALAGCVPEEEDDDDDDSSVPVVRYLV